MPTSNSTSCVDRTCFHADRANPPITAIGKVSGSRVIQTAANVLAQLWMSLCSSCNFKPIAHTNHRTIVIIHNLLVPFAIKSCDVLFGPCFSLQSG